VKTDKRKVFDGCFIGRLFEYKGIYDLLKAWKLVKETMNEAQLLIIGDAPSITMKKIGKLLYKYGLINNVTIIRYAPEIKKIRLLKSCKTFIFPSYAEGIPLVFYEAMYAGIPIITYYLPSYEDIASCIMKVKIGDINELAKTIKTLLKDNKLRALLSQKVKLCSLGHDWENLYQSFIRQLNGMGFLSE
jgi:glycosyltransferase involved in cell wall biosynthesis